MYKDSASGCLSELVARAFLQPTLRSLGLLLCGRLPRPSTVFQEFVKNLRSRNVSTFFDDVKHAKTAKQKHDFPPMWRGDCRFRSRTAIRYNETPFVKKRPRVMRIPPQKRELLKVVPTPSFPRQFSCGLRLSHPPNPPYGLKNQSNVEKRGSDRGEYVENLFSK